MQSVDWTWFCGTNRLVIWSDDDFGTCFRNFALDVPSYALLAIISAFYAGNRSFYLLRSPSQLRILTLRKLIVLSLLLVPVSKLATKLSLSRDDVTVADYVSVALKALGLLLHFVFLFILRTRVTPNSRGPFAVVFGWFLTVVSTVFAVRSFVIIENINLVSWKGDLVKYAVYAELVLQILYFCTLIPKGRANGTVQRRLVDFVGNSRQPLVGIDSFSGSYGTMSGQPAPAIHLGIAERNVNFLSRLMLCWVNPLLEKGCSERFQSADDLFDLPSQLHTTYIDTKFWIVFRDLQLRSSLASERERIREDGFVGSESDVRVENVKSFSILWALLRCFSVEYVLLGTLKFLTDGFSFVGPMLLNSIVNYIESGERSNSTFGYYYVLGLFGTSFVSAFCNSQYSYLLNNLKLKVRASLISMVYRKTLHLRCSEMTSFSIGEIMNFMSTDTDRIVNICDSFHALWIQPIQIAVCLYLLHLQVGSAYLAGVGFAVLLIPINHWIAKKIGTLSSSMMTQKDLRVKVMAELLYGIKVIKYYSWEGHLWNRVSKLRDAEVKSLKGLKYLDAFCVFFWATTPIIIALLTFSTFILLGNQLTVAKVFTCLALFNVLIVPLNAFPWVIGGVVQGYVSVKRVQKLVHVKESNLTKCYASIDEGSNLALYVRKGRFIWNRNGTDKMSDQLEVPLVSPRVGDPEYRFRLEDINIEVFKDEFVGVCGPVGSGKSSLLLAILSEMKRLSGEIGSCCVADGFAYVAQESWIQNATVKQNILFGRPLQLERYYDVVSACALDEDLKSFPAGDDTLIGERGINLSGGQKTRIALARALYQDKDIYLIDDVLSTVDVHVGQHIVHNCFYGILNQKTRILSTHHWRYLSRADQILMMQDGRIVKQGKPDSILNDLKMFEQTEVTETSTEADGSINNDVSKPSDKKSREVKVVDRDTSLSSSSHEEEWDRGSIHPKVYIAYGSAMGYVLTVVILLSFVIMQGLKNISDWWLAHWMSETSSNLTNRFSSRDGSDFSGTLEFSKPDSQSNGGFSYYLTVYCVLILSNAAVAMVRAFSFAYGGVRAAIKLHNNLLRMILRASTRFFDVTPVGRIINRFSTDTCKIDDSLPFNLNILLAQAFGLIGTLVVICYSLPWLLLLLVPLAGIYVDVQNYYRHTSRQLRRLEAVTLSPIYAHFSESVLGLATIRAYRSEARFKKENEQRLERNQRTCFALGATSSWLSLRLQLIGVAVITGIGFLAIVEHNFQGIHPGLVGLALSYGLSITAQLSAVVQVCTETEKHAVSVERTVQYVDGVEPERWEGFAKPPFDWPNRGIVAFHSVQLRYREHLPYVLDSVTFSTKPAEKLGIVGRTGAGKSSLFTALFRLVEVEKGGITIDGQVIAYLDLADLRGQVTIIPQDPFIFSGTVRDNLDPSHSFSDDDLWDALHQCHLGDLVERYGGLDVELAERGLDFSMGQRQLLCLSRAVIARTKVLCIDEATANVDHDTDKLLQKTIRSAFRDSTVLTIAHRLETILDSDRILVMSEGRVVELDSPQALLSNSDSHFFRLVNKREWPL